MMHTLRNHGWRSIRQLLTAWVAAIYLICPGAALQADQRGDTRKRYVELDSEIQAIKEEILEINRDILLLEEMSLYPPGEQLVVLVSLAGGNTVNPERITLQVDGKTVAQHDYSGSEGAALREGGVHRLYAGKLSEGEHTLQVSLSGSLASDKTFQQQRNVSITKIPGRKYMELQLGPGEKSSEAGLTIREWQQ